MTSILKQIHNTYMLRKKKQRKKKSNNKKAVHQRHFNCLTKTWTPDCMTVLT